MTFAKTVESIIDVINTLIVPTILALTFLAFVYGVLKYFFFEGDDKARENGRRFMLWGILAMVVVFSVWGVVALMLSTLGLT